MKQATATSSALKEKTQPKAVREPEATAGPTDKRSESNTQSSSPVSPLKLEPPVHKAAPEEEQIRRRAYELYVESGYVDGNSEEHWFAAEREIVAKGK